MSAPTLPPGVRIRLKSESRLMRFLGSILGAWFMHSAWTTIGPRTIWAPVGARLDRLDVYALIIQHELVHVAQAKRWLVLFQLSYLLLPLPIWLAWCRWRWEREAYLVQLRAGASPAVLADLLWRRYGWPWPRPLMRRWFERALARGV